MVTLRTTRLAVVAYPTLGAADRQWIESFRVQHDPQGETIAAHFTLVFPVDADPEAVAKHVGAVAGDSDPIRVVAKEMRAVRDESGPGGHVFLVPEGGYAELVALHGRLHGGLLQGHRRRDIPYVPHVTIAAFPDFERCLTAAHDLGMGRRVVEGYVGSVDVVRIGSNTVQSLTSFPLGHAGSGKATG